MGNCVGRQRGERPAAPGHPRKRAGNDGKGSRATGAPPVVPLLARALGFPSDLPRFLAPGFPRRLLPSLTGGPSPALVAGGRVGATGSADPASSSTRSNWEAPVRGGGGGRKCLQTAVGPTKGRRARGGGAAGLAPGPGSDTGPLGHSAGGQASPELGASEARTVAPSKDCVIIRLQIVSAGIRLAKAPQDSGKEIFIFPAGPFRASRPSGNLGKVGCGVGIALGCAGILPGHGNGICSLVICEDWAAPSHFLGTLLSWPFIPGRSVTI